MNWYTEYAYRKLFPGITHEQYLDNVTVEERNWLLRIDDVVESVRAEKEKSTM